MKSGGKRFEAKISVVLRNDSPFLALRQGKDKNAEKDKQAREQAKKNQKKKQKSTTEAPAPGFRGYTNPPEGRFQSIRNLNPRPSVISRFRFNLW